MCCAEMDRRDFEMADGRAAGLGDRMVRGGLDGAEGKRQEARS